MTCISTLRHVWPISLCVNYDSDEEEWPPPWPKMSETDQQHAQSGYLKSQIIHNPTAKSLQSPMSEKNHPNRVKTSRDREPPMPSLPPQFYDLPPDSQARARGQSPDCRKGRSRSRSQSRNRLVKSRTASMSSSRSRPSIGAPSDFRKVAGHDRPMMTVPRVPPLPANPANPPMDSWRRVSNRRSKRVSRKVAFRPLELAIHREGNELEPLPRFSRLILDPADVGFLRDYKTSSRPASMARVSRSRSRKSIGSRKSVHRVSNNVPKMPFIRHSAASVESDISFDDSESVLDPDFNPAPQKQRQSRRLSRKESKSLEQQIEHIRPPVPLKTRSLLPSPREEKSQVSPISPPPRGRNGHPNSLKLDDLPSAFSSPASPNAPAGWREAQDPFQNLDAAVEAANEELVPRGSIPYTNNTTHRVSTPERSLNPKNQTPSREEALIRASPTPSASSSISTAISNVSGSTRSISTAATSPPSPISELKKSALMQQPPKAALAMAPPMAPHANQVREMVVQRVVADAPLLQPAPRIPTKSPRRLLPMIEEASPTNRNSLDNRSIMPPVLHAAYGPQVLPKRPFASPLQTEMDDISHFDNVPKLQQAPLGFQQLRQAPQPTQQEQLQQMPAGLQLILKAGSQNFDQPRHQVVKQGPPPRPARPDEVELPLPLLQPAQAPPRPARPDESALPPPQPTPVKPQLRVQTNPNVKEQDWTQTGSAWREVVWGLKRRTQDEAAYRAREQQVVIETASANSENEEAWRNRDLQFGESPHGTYRSGPRSGHWRGPSGGSNGSNHMRGGSNESTGGGSEVMEVPVGLALDGVDESSPPHHMMGPQAAAQSNDALLHLQPSIAHDMHAIVEEDEEDEDNQVPKKPMLAVRNGMPEPDSDDEMASPPVPKPAPLASHRPAPEPSPPVQLTPQAYTPHATTPSAPAMPTVTTPTPTALMAPRDAVYSDSEPEASDDEDGEEVEFGLDEGIWEMVESNPASSHASLANAHTSVTVVGIQDRSSRDTSRSTSMSAEQSRDASVDSSRQSSRSASASSSSRGSRTSMYITPSSFPRDFAAPPRDAPPMPKVPTNLGDAELQFPKPPTGVPSTPTPADKPKTPKTPKTPPVTAHGPPAGDWGKGLGMEFGIAY